MCRLIFLPALLLSWGWLDARAQAQTTNAPYTHFEARQTHPIGLTPDGRRLLALNSAEGRLSVFDISNPTQAAPLLIAEIPVGLEPVSLRARTNDEVWVVNEVSDSVSVVSLSLGVTVATLPAADEPADVVFAQDKAFVSCGRNNLVRVFNVTTLAEVAAIPLNGQQPRALAVAPGGTKVFATFQLSGNRTTTLPPALAPAPPAPTNPALPAAPRTGLIVPADDPRVPYTVLDHDVAEIGVSENRVNAYYSDIGTNLLDLAIDPTSGALWIAATDALNLTRFEPQLRGHFVDNQVTRLTVPAGDRRRHDLNAGIDYGTLPNPAAQAAALSQPMAVVFSPDGQGLWVAAFGSDRVARLTAADGAITARIDLRPVGAGARQMRGPRGLAVHPTLNRMYIFNKLSDTIAVVDTASTESAAVMAEIPVASHDPMPATIREGRGFLFDARLSGNGTASCASCHLDADRDGLAWDLGDPGGAMLTVQGRNNSIHDATPRPRVLHPMKGPMTTQTLRGLQSHRIFHWRGDRPSLESFNPTFRDLMGGPLLDDAEMAALTTYLLSLRHHPNPHRQLDRSLPTTLAAGNPVRGRDLYNDHPKSHCVTCHTLPTGSDENIDLMAEVGSSQPVKTVSLRTVYQRAGFDGTAGAVNVSGYGLLHDGTGFRLPRGHFYVLDTLDTRQELNDVTAFLLCFDTGTAPTVGFSRTLTAATAAEENVATLITTLESQAAAAACDAVVRGRIAGQWRQFLYDATSQLYLARGTTVPGLTRAQLLAGLGDGDALTFLGVPPGQGSRLGADRDGDGVPDADEPIPDLTIDPVGSLPRLSWPHDSRDWTLETGSAPITDWQPVTEPRIRNDARWELIFPPTTSTHFFRLRRTW